MAYNKGSKGDARGRGFYEARGAKRHGENTGEWTRDDYQRRDGRAEGPRGARRGSEPRSEYRGERNDRPPRPEYRGERNDRPPRAEYRGERGDRPPRAEYRAEPAEPRDDSYRREGRFEYRSERPRRYERGTGTRDSERTSARPVYENAFADSAAEAPEVSGEFDQSEPENLLVGRNPIREAIKSGRDIEKLLVQRGELSGSAREIIAKAREAHIVVQEVDKSRLDDIYPNHQGMIAYASAAVYSTLDDILARAEESGEPPFIVVLDGITDPHNLGAIIRTAECAGAHGVIIGQRRSVGLTPAAVKASAGAVEYMPVAKVVNISRTLEQLKERNIWVTGTASDGEPIAQADLSGAIAVVIGAEGEGLSQLVRRECDRVVALPMRGHIESLNASVAAGVIMYAARAARDS